MRRGPPRAAAPASSSLDNPWWRRRPLFVFVSSLSPHAHGVTSRSRLEQISLPAHRICCFASFSVVGQQGLVQRFTQHLTALFNLLAIPPPGAEDVFLALRCAGCARVELRLREAERQGPRWPQWLIHGPRSGGSSTRPPQDPGHAALGSRDFFRLIAALSIVPETSVGGRRRGVFLDA